MTIFAVSDIHGHASIFQASLAKSGFIPNKPEHILVCCGDCFDRGAENKELYDCLKKISNKIIIRGNHEEMLMNAIRRGSINIWDMYNGTEATIEDLFGSSSIDRSGKIIISGYRKKQIMDFLSQTADCYETQNYVFVHGWIPEENPLTGDWRTATAHGWSDARWVSWMEMHHKYTASNKTVVCGHRASRYAAALDASRASDDHSPYYGAGFIAIDSNTVRSQAVNVLVIEDEPLEHGLHFMKLQREFFDKVARGSKTVEMRLYDEKRRQIKRGDTIAFTADDDSGETIRVTVSGIYVYPSFEALTDEFDARALGFERRRSAYICEYMKRFYNAQSVGDYGVAAIKIGFE